MEKTTFAGLTILEPGEGLDTDNGAFIDGDRRTIDHFLRLGAKLHRHNGAAGLSNPTVAPSGAVIASGGTIPSNLTVSIGYTLEDSAGGETMLSPLAVVSTGSPMDIPIAAPSASANYEAGSLLVDTYYYAVTFLDGEGGETPAGPAVSVERAPGFASGRVLLTNLTYGMEAAGAVGWRLFRAKGGGTYDLLATGGLGDDSFTDDGTASVNCDIHPPTDSQNTTRRINTLLVTLPKADANMAKSSFINLYGSVSGEFGEASSLGQFPIASAGASVTYASLDFNDASPPDVNLSVGGASQIDPDTELLDWHWKRPVAASAALGSGTLGDVRLSTDTGYLYAVLAPSAVATKPSEWVRIASAVSPRATQQVAGSGLALTVGFQTINNCEYTVPETGIYEVTCHADVLCEATGGAAVVIALIGAEESSSGVFSATAVNARTPVSLPVLTKQIPAGTVIKMQAKKTGGSYQVMTTHSKLLVRRVE